MRILVTGAAGFIGFHLCRRLLAEGHEVVGVDSFTTYYSPQLKRARIASLGTATGLRFHELDICNAEGIDRLFADGRPEIVVNLAAQAGVRYSIENPRAYVEANVAGFLNVLEGCRAHPVRHIVFASSSSVYGANARVPFSEADGVDHPVSLYAATKRSNELMAHTYSHLFGIPCTGLRFFTVYGPWGRPDMAYYSFAKAIMEDRPIDVFNNGQMERDFTYVDDVVEGVWRVMQRPPAVDPDWDATKSDPASSRAPYRVYNIGNHEPVALTRMIEILEQELGRPARVRMKPMQPGDVVRTYADVSRLARDTGFSPSTPLHEGLARFVEWFVPYHRD